jgi:hypothetical protein
MLFRIALSLEYRLALNGLLNSQSPPPSTRSAIMLLYTYASGRCQPGTHGAHPVWGGTRLDAPVPRRPSNGVEPVCLSAEPFLPLLSVRLFPPATTSAAIRCGFAWPFSFTNSESEVSIAAISSKRGSPLGTRAGSSDHPLPRLRRPPYSLEATC